MSGIAVDEGEHIGPADIRPTVGQDTGNRPLWIAIAGILAVGLLLFVTLNAHRTALTAPSVRQHSADLTFAPSAAPPLLYIPPEPVMVMPERFASIEKPREAVPQAAPPPPRQEPPAINPFRNEPAFSTPPPVAATTPQPAPVNNSPAVVLDTTGADGDTATLPGSGGSAGAAGMTATATRARASRLLNRATVVPQGTLIAAVLETALDSTQPGQARALVASDVANLHGDHILIPRGSRLFGSYNGELMPGQKRAQVQWTRLVRPDGVTIAIDSPAADRLGRAGIRGRVNTHFLERFGSALLQSTIDVGTSVASRAIYDGSSVIVAVPGGGQGGGGSSQLIGQAPKPTLKIRQGTRISVFVVRDLDFTAVETKR